MLSRDELIGLLVQWDGEWIAGKIVAFHLEAWNGYGQFNRTDRVAAG